MVYDTSVQDPPAANIDPPFTWQLSRANSPLRPVKGRGIKEGFVNPRSFAPRVIANDRLGSFRSIQKLNFGKESRITFYTVASSLNLSLYLQR